MLTRRRGAPTRRMTAVAAAGSVGETIAPRTKAIAHGRSRTSWPMTATMPVVASTSPMALNAITRASWRSALRSEKKAEAYNNGGRKTSRTRSGSSWTSGMPGSSPSPSPPRTSGIGYGTWSQLATALRPAAETNSAAMTICRSPTAQSLDVGRAELLARRRGGLLAQERQPRRDDRVRVVGQRPVSAAGQDRHLRVAEDLALALGQPHLQVGGLGAPHHERRPRVLAQRGRDRGDVRRDRRVAVQRQDRAAGALVLVEVEEVVAVGHGERRRVRALHELAHPAARRRREEQLAEHRRPPHAGQRVPALAQQHA